MMSWGYRITFLYLGFAGLIATLVVLSMRETVDLVSADYYEQELNFQSRIDAVERTHSLNEKLAWEIDQHTIKLTFPSDLKDSTISGSIFFFRPSNSRLDHTETIPLSTSGIAEIPLEKLRRGMYQMQISWKTKTTEYYNDGVIQIQ